MDPKPEPQPEVEPPTTSTPAKLAAEEARLLELTNQARKEAGLKPLQVNMGLVETARAKSADMVANNYFGHISLIWVRRLIRWGEQKSLTVRQGRT